jgi:hypothetical protein
MSFIMCITLGLIAAPLTNTFAESVPIFTNGYARAPVTFGFANMSVKVQSVTSFTLGITYKDIDGDKPGFAGFATNNIFMNIETNSGDYGTIIIRTNGGPYNYASGYVFRLATTGTQQHVFFLSGTGGYGTNTLLNLSTRFGTNLTYTFMMSPVSGAGVSQTTNYPGWNARAKIIFDDAPPAAVALWTTNITFNSAQAVWTHCTNSDLSGTPYRLNWGKNILAMTNTSGTLFSTTTNYTIASLSPNSLYHYRLAVSDNVGNKRYITNQFNTPNGIPWFTNANATAPTLFGPGNLSVRGSDQDTFTFRITYKDADGDQPGYPTIGTNFIFLMILTNGQPYGRAAILTNGGPIDYAAGYQFAFSVTGTQPLVLYTGPTTKVTNTLFALSTQHGTNLQYGFAAYPVSGSAIASNGGWLYFPLSNPPQIIVQNDPPVFINGYARAPVTYGFGNMSVRARSVTSFTLGITYMDVNGDKPGYVGYGTNFLILAFSTNYGDMGGFAVFTNGGPYNYSTGYQFRFVTSGTQRHVFNQSGVNYTNSFKNLCQRFGTNLNYSFMAWPVSGVGVATQIKYPDWSNPARIVIDDTPPPAVTLNVTNAFFTTAMATWTRSASPDLASAPYRLQWGKTLLTMTNSSGIISASTTNFPLSGLTRNTTYFCRLMLSDSVGNTSFSTDSFTTMNAPPRLTNASATAPATFGIGNMSVRGSDSDTFTFRITYMDEDGDKPGYPGVGTNFIFLLVLVNNSEYGRMVLRTNGGPIDYTTGYQFVESVTGGQPLVFYTGPTTMVTNSLFALSQIHGTNLRYMFGAAPVTGAMSTTNGGVTYPAAIWENLPQIIIENNPPVFTNGYTRAPVTFGYDNMSIKAQSVTTFTLSVTYKDINGDKPGYTGFLTNSIFMNIATNGMDYGSLLIRTNGGPINYSAGYPFRLATSGTQHLLIMTAPMIVSTNTFQNLSARYGTNLTYTFMMFPVSGTGTTNGQNYPDWNARAKIIIDDTPPLSVAVRTTNIGFNSAMAYWPRCLSADLSGTPYRLYWGKNLLAMTNTSGTLSSSTTNFTLGSLSPNSLYHYRLAISDDVGNKRYVTNQFSTLNAVPVLTNANATAPTLFGPGNLSVRGSDQDTFTFRITYKDADGDKPGYPTIGTNFIFLMILTNGQPYGRAAILTNGGPIDYTAGYQFAFSVTGTQPLVMYTGPTTKVTNTLFALSTIHGTNLQYGYGAFPVSGASVASNGGWLYFPISNPPQIIVQNDPPVFTNGFARAPVTFGFGNMSVKARSVTSFTLSVTYKDINGDKPGFAGFGTNFILMFMITNHNDMGGFAVFTNGGPIDYQTGYRFRLVTTGTQKHFFPSTGTSYSFLDLAQRYGTNLNYIFLAYPVSGAGMTTDLKFPDWANAAKIIIDDTPPAAVPVRTTNISYTSGLVQWNRSLANDLASSPYRLQWGKTTFTMTNSSGLLGPATTNYSLTGLSRNTAYFFRLTVSDDVGNPVYITNQFSTLNSVPVLTNASATAPALFGPGNLSVRGSDKDTFTFRISYKDADGDKPGFPGFGTNFIFFLVQTNDTEYGRLVLRTNGGAINYTSGYQFNFTVTGGEQLVFYTGTATMVTNSLFALSQLHGTNLRYMFGAIPVSGATNPITGGIPYPSTVWEDLPRIIVQNDPPVFTNGFARAPVTFGFDNMSVKARSVTIFTLAVTYRDVNGDKPGYTGFITNIIFMNIATNGLDFGSMLIYTNGGVLDYTMGYTFRLATTATQKHAFMTSMSTTITDSFKSLSSRYGTNLTYTFMSFPVSGIGTTNGQNYPDWSARAKILIDDTPPAGVSFATNALTQTNVRIVWTRSPTADLPSAPYALEWGTSTGFGSTSGYLSATNSTLTSLIPGTKYYCRLLVRDDVFNIRIAGTNSFTTPGIPALPGAIAGLTVPADQPITAHSIPLRWNSDQFSSGYLVYTNQSGKTNLIALAFATNISLSGLSPNRFYRFTVKGTNSAGKSPSFSLSAGKYTALPTPSLVSFGVSSSTNVSVRWTVVSGSSGYKLVCRTSSNTVSTFRIAAPATNRNFVSTYLGFPNDLQVIATNLNTPANAYLSSSNFLKVDFSQISFPAGLTAVMLSTNRVALSWNDLSAESGYVITTNSPLAAYRAVTLGPNATAWTDTRGNKGRTMTYYLFGTNAQGSSALESATIIVDLPTAPVVRYPTNRQYIRDPNHKLAWSRPNDVSGIAGYALIFNAASNWIASGSQTNPFPPSLFTAGQNVWRVSARDGTGNYSAPSPWITNILDTTAPSAPVLIGPTGAVTNLTGSLDWHPSTDDYAVGSYDVELDGARYANGIATNRSFTLTEGTHAWRVRAADRATNRSAWSSSNTFVIDRSAPTAVVLLSPAIATVTSSAAVSFRWKRSTDASGPAGYVFALSGWTTNTGTATNLVRILPDAAYAWRIRAYDGLGHTNTWSSSNTLIVDTTAPSAFTAVLPADGTVLTGTLPELSWTRSIDGLSGLSGYRVLIGSNNLAFTQVSVLRPSSLTNWNVTSLLGNGNWQWTVLAIDNAGNTVSCGTNTFVLQGVKYAEEDTKKVLLGPSLLGNGDGLHFVHLPSKATIRIFTPGGRLVSELKEEDGDGVFDWDTVVDGAPLGSGVYLVRIENASDPKDFIIIKFAVAR